MWRKLNNSSFKCECGFVAHTLDAMKEHDRKHIVIAIENKAEAESGKPVSSAGFEDIEEAFLALA